MIIPKLLGEAEKARAQRRKTLATTLTTAAWTIQASNDLYRSIHAEIWEISHTILNWQALGHTRPDAAKMTRERILKLSNTLAYPNHETEYVAASDFRSICDSHATEVAELKEHIQTLESARRYDLMAEADLIAQIKTMTTQIEVLTTERDNAQARYMDESRKYANLVDAQRNAGGNSNAN
jgi:hypothetical protein